MEKKIILMSNSKNHLINNTLTHFQNRFLDPSYLKAHKQWEISLEHLAFHANFKNSATSKNNAYPCLLHCTRFFCTDDLKCDLFDKTQSKPKLRLTQFQERQKFYLNEKKSYTPLMLHQEFTKRSLTISKHDSKQQKLANYSGFVTKVDQENKILLFKQYKYPFDKLSNDYTRKQLRTILFFHENFKKTLKFADNLFDGTIKIDNELYFWIYNSKKRKPLQLSLYSESLFIKPPNLIKVVCINVRPSITQEAYSQEIAYIHIDKENVGQYIHRKFHTKDSFVLEDEQITNLEIQLLDENQNDLRLSNGLPTVVKLHAKEANMHQFGIHVNSTATSSFPENRPGLFKIRLPKTLNLMGDWKCALSSITFRNDLEIDANLDFHFTVSLLSNSVNNIDIETLPLNSDQEKVFKVDLKIRNIDQIIEFFIDNIKQWIEVIKSPKNILLLKFKANAKLKVSPFLSKLLGISSIVSESLILKEKGEVFLCSLPIEYGMPLFTQSIFVNTSFLEYSILAHTFAKILKVIAVPQKTQGKYVTLEFDSLEYIPLLHSEICELDFTLKGVSGAELKFHKSEFSEIYMNLIFKKF